MPLGLDFGQRKRSPYLDRKDRTFGRTGGRPPEAPRTTAPSGAPQLGGGTTGVTGTIGGQVTPPGGQATTGTGSGIQATQRQTPYAGFLSELTRPVGTPYQSQFKERAGLLREYTQGAYSTAAEGVREKLGAKGIRPGESGIADTAIGRIQKAGAEELTRGYRGLASEEGRREQEFKLGTAGLNLQRQLGGAGLALRGEEGAMQNLFQYYGGQQAAEAREWQPYWQTGY